MEHQSRNKPYAKLWGKRKREVHFSVKTNTSAEQQISLFIPTHVSPQKAVRETALKTDQNDRGPRS